MPARRYSALQGIAPAHVRRRVPDGRLPPGKAPCSRSAGYLLGLIIPVAFASPACAQVALGIGIDSDYRHRGYSLSEGRPTASVTAAYDDPSGFYLNGSVLGVHRDDGPDLLGYQANVGYARRLGSTISVDGGVVHSRYRYPYYGRIDTRSYTEAYVGAHVRDFTARIYYSPRYFADGVSTAYGELEAAYQPSPNWRLNAHAGVLVYLDRPAYSYLRRSYDWRLSASRQFGRAEAHAAISGGGPGRDYYDHDDHSRTALTVGASLSF